MKLGIALATAALAALGGCRASGTPNNSEGIAALTANNSAFRGGAAPSGAGNAVTNSGTGVTGGNGTASVTGRNANTGSGARTGGAQSSGPAPSAPGTR
jgi:hypothetical protein